MNRRGAIERLDAYQRRHTWLGFPLATSYKYFEDQGPFLAAMITYYGFLSLFPLLLLFTTILGFVLHGSPSLQHQIVQSALSRFPIIGDQIEQNVGSLHGSGLAVTVGLLGTLYGGLGVSQAVQTALHRVWSVPRNQRPNPFESRLRGLALLFTVGAGVIATTALSALTSGVHVSGAQLGLGLRVVATILAIVVNALLLLFAFRLATARDVSTRDIRTGAIIAAVGWQVLQTVGVVYLRRLLDTTQVYGLFSIVLGALAWLYLQAVILVVSAEINVVRRRRLWPRALLTPVTDDVDLTAADKSVYASHAATERYKGFERVDVSFEDSDSEPER